MKEQISHLLYIFITGFIFAGMISVIEPETNDQNVDNNNSKEYLMVSGELKVAPPYPPPPIPPD